MDLKPFISNVNSWRNHFKEMSKTGYRRSKKYQTVQDGSGFPLDNIISVTPTKQAEDIAKSEIIEINKASSPVKRKYKKRSSSKSTQSASRIRQGKIKKSNKSISNRKTNKVKKKTLSHRKRK